MNTRSSTTGLGTRTDDAALTTAQVLKMLGLGTYWTPALVRELRTAAASRGPSGWSLPKVLVWKRRTMATIDQLGPAQLRALALRSTGMTPTSIRSRAHVSITHRTIDQWGLALALAYTHDLVPMRRGRAGDRLRRNGYPPPGAVPPPVARAVLDLWNDGTARAHIGTQTRLGETALGRVLAAAPPRLRTGDITRRFGWSPDNIHQKLRHGTFPPPDGMDGHVRWWWASTVDDWEHGANLKTCPACGARVQRIHQHQRAHAPKV